VRRVLLVAIGALVICLGITFGLALASPDLATRTTLHFTDRTQQARIVDAGKHGPHLGSEIVFGDVLYSSGTKVGRLGGSFEWIRRHPDEYNMVASLTIKSGKITLQGLVRNSSTLPGKSYRVAVTGGTGVYANARGTAEFQVQSASVATLTLHLIP
jgi:Allene oxide cyclase barrel like domain